MARNVCSTHKYITCLLLVINVHQFLWKKDRRFPSLEEFFASSRYECRGQVITPTVYVGVITCPCAWYLFMAGESLFEAYSKSQDADGSTCIVFYSGLTHWGRVTHICVGKRIIIGSDNGLSRGRRQAIIWTNAGILWFGPLRTNFSEILSEIHSFSFKKMHLKMSSAKWRPFVPASIC